MVALSFSDDQVKQSNNTTKHRREKKKHRQHRDISNSGSQLISCMQPGWARVQQILPALLPIKDINAAAQRRGRRQSTAAAKKVMPPAAAPSRKKDEGCRTLLLISLRPLSCLPEAIAYRHNCYVEHGVHDIHR
jgi:hypothetical protein